MGIFEHIIGTSALNQINVGELLSMLEGMVDDGPYVLPGGYDNRPSGEIYSKRDNQRKAAALSQGRGASRSSR